MKNYADFYPEDLPAAMSSARLTQFGLGLSTGIHPSTISRLVSGNAHPTADQKRRIGEVFANKQRGDDGA